MCRVPHCFYSHFPGDILCGASFHIYHRYLFFGEVSVKVFGPLLNWGACIFFELEFSMDICKGMGLWDHMVTLFLVF